MPFFETDNVRLHYSRAGKRDARVLVFHHSLRANLSQWERQARLLGETYDILQFDARGHGLSTVPEGPYEIAQFGRDLLALVEHLRIDRFAFCGLSLGSMVGLWLAAHAPGRVERMVLAGVSARVSGRASRNSAPAISSMFREMPMPA